jgi:U3 small nucleolar RNA-associated protein 21
VPFTSVPLGKTTFQITTSVGRCLHTYDLTRGLNLVFLTRPQAPEDITATLAWKDRVFAAWGEGARHGVWVYKRGKKIDELQLPVEHDEPIRELSIFGSWIIGVCSKMILVWRTATYELYTTLNPVGSRKEGGGQLLSGGICHLPTYLNKVLAGREDGSVEIWNVSTGKLVFTILPPSSDSGRVTALCPTPAMSLLAIAYEDGSLRVVDIRFDRTVMLLNTGLSRKSAISSISFRTDGLGAGDDGKKDGVMATSTSDSGDVTLWDLNKGGRIMGVLRGAHNPPSSRKDRMSGGINKIEFLAGQPVLMTGGKDNALKSWIFDESPYSPIPRVLHVRSGHAAPVTRLQFLPSDADGSDAGGKWLLSAGQDRSLWGWSLRRDGQSTELSQGNIRKKAKKIGILANGITTTETSTTMEDLKAPEITCIAMSLNRDGGMGSAKKASTIWTKTSGQSSKASSAAKGADGNVRNSWESILTGHKGDKYARTWFWGGKKAGRWAFETSDGGDVQSVAVSPCGTFGIIGSSTGAIDMYNLQSGLHRQRYPPKLTPAQARKYHADRSAQLNGEPSNSGTGRKFALGTGKHTNAVTGIVIDSLNRTVISCGKDGKVKFWDFATGLLLDVLDWSLLTAVTASRFHASNDLIALACTDLSIRVVDIETKRVVRELRGCSGGITDFAFSNDGRWVIAASLDAVIRVWDLPTGHLIDAFRLDQVCTALAFSGTGEFLATAYDTGVGVDIW